MKKSIISMAVAAIVSLFALTSCEKEPEDLIVGKWTMTTINITYGGISMDFDPSEVDMAATFTFKADGTGSLLDSENTEAMPFTYRMLVEGDKQLLSFTLDGETILFDVLTLSDESLVLSQEENEDGESIKTTMTFTRA
jgi:hypothetical protein